MSSPTPIIHVVDDDDSFRTAVMRLLRAAGYEVRDYPSAGDFLLVRPGNTPGCVLLDVRMPGPSGLDLQVAFGEQDIELPIIFLTGHGDIPMSVRAMKGGAVDFLTKPVKRETLLNAVQNALVRDAENRTARGSMNALRSRYENLTPRERVVFAHVVAGNWALVTSVSSIQKPSTRTRWAGFSSAQPSSESVPMVNSPPGTQTIPGGAGFARRTTA